MTADEFEEALSDTSHMMAEVTASDRGTRLEDITSIRLLLSNGRRIVIEPCDDIDHRLMLSIEEEA